MGIGDYKVKSEDFNNKDIMGLPDRPSEAGFSAEQLKARFDAGAKRVVAPNLNALIDALLSTEGAANIGATQIAGVAGYTVQEILAALKVLLDTKQSIEQSNIDVNQKFDKTEAQALVKEIGFAANTGVFTITKYDGSVQTIDTALEKVALDVRLEGQQFVLTLADGTVQRVDLSAFLTQTELKDSTTIALAEEAGVLVARLLLASVTKDHLAADATAYLEAKESAAAASAAEAGVQAGNALASANSAAASKVLAQECAEDACSCAANAAASESTAGAKANAAALSAAGAAQSAASAASEADRAKGEADRAAAIVGGDYATRDELEAHERAADSKFDEVEEKLFQLQMQIGYPIPEVAGVELDFENDTSSRIMGSAGHSAGDDYFNNFGAYQRRRCNLADDGTVLAYYGDAGYKEDGTNGMVMVEQPKFYYRVEPLALDLSGEGAGYGLKKARYYICDKPHEGFRVHPAFVENGVERERIYLAAYLGSIYDQSEGTYCLDDTIKAGETDLLCSIGGAKPVSAKDTGEGNHINMRMSRILSENRGSGWHLQSVQSLAATQLLFLIEYGTLDIWEQLGACSTMPFGAEQDPPLNGSTAEFGNFTGSKIVYGEESGQYVRGVTYRGEENLYHRLQYIDGIKFSADSENTAQSHIYITDYAFTETITAGYQDTGLSLFYPDDTSGTTPVRENTILYSTAYDWLFLANRYRYNSESLHITGNDTIYYPGSEGESYATVGGCSIYGSGSGINAWRLDRSSEEYAIVIDTARLRYMPEA